ncbi:arginyltransferase [Myxococcota bacterium]|nr:arginyltransferase [Myxococcota bacterium]
MARSLRHFVADPSICAYLPDRESSLEYRLLTDVSPAELEHLLERGWRRFGFAYFRPACDSCSECVPLRIPTAAFRPSKQQRRVRNKTRHLTVQVGVPEVDRERLALYTAWHDMQAARRGWREDTITPEDYYQQFAFPHPSVRELAFYAPGPEPGDPPELVAISIVDETPNAMSAVYTYHSPAHAKLSLGTASILIQLELAKLAGKSNLYLGYRVLGCASSRYKARFRPHEVLEGWPGFGEAPVWRPGPEVDFARLELATEGELEA